MTVLTKAIHWAFSETSYFTKNQLLRNVVLLGAAGLFVWILTLTYGIDLSPAFF